MEPKRPTKRLTMRDVLKNVLDAPMVQLAPVDPFKRKRFALQPMNARRRLRARRQRIREHGVAPKLNDRGRANVRSRLTRSKRREKVVA